jgi:hypothetical protein
MDSLKQEYDDEFPLPEAEPCELDGFEVLRNHGDVFKKTIFQYSSSPQAWTPSASKWREKATRKTRLNHVSSSTFMSKTDLQSATFIVLTHALQVQ